MSHGGHRDQRTFGSLRAWNYRLFFFGQLVSAVGEWAQIMAEAWLLLTLTHNGAAVGGAFVFRFAPVLLFGLWVGSSPTGSIGARSC